MYYIFGIVSFYYIVQLFINWQMYKANRKLAEAKRELEAAKKENERLAMKHTSNDLILKYFENTDVYN